MQKTSIIVEKFFDNVNAENLAGKRPYMNSLNISRTKSAAYTFAKKNIVFLISLAAACVSMLFIPPDEQYLQYFDWKTLSCLFCTLAVICALRNICFFTLMARKLIILVGNLRTAAFALTGITFFGSMLIANDMALLTFLPLGYLVLSSSGKEKHMAVIFILQNIAANLGGMLTPFGNPQNLYLYTRFNIPNAEFISIMLIPFAAAACMIAACCLFIPSEPLVPLQNNAEHIPLGRASLYLALFALTILCVFRLIPYPAMLAAVFFTLLFADRKALIAVDYPLLLTFAAFFIFSGNMARISAVHDLLAGLLQKNALLTTVCSCQLISNVPTAILLSGFTENYRALLLGVNIGSAGTLISSLASLITFREYSAHNKGGAARYIGLFSAFNFAFLAVLTVISLLLC